jgi:hypothetical protein
MPEQARDGEAPFDAVPAEAPPLDAGRVVGGQAEAAPVGDDRPLTADEGLLAAHDLARTALLEITPESTIGPVVGHDVEGEHVVSLLFECTLLGYPGWNWTVSLARVDGDAEPVVLEAELLPGDHALLAPDWVPWSERLAEYQAAQEAARAAGAADGDASEDAGREGDTAADELDDADDSDVLDDADVLDDTDVLDDEVDLDEEEDLDDEDDLDHDDDLDDEDELDHDDDIDGIDIDLHDVGDGVDSDDADDTDENGGHGTR